MLEVILLKVMYLRLLMQNKIIHVKTFTNEYDIEVEWDLTTRCNYSCSYCKSYDNTQPLALKTLEEYESVISYLTSYFPEKIIKFDFLGGEPTLFKHWAELLEIVNSKKHIFKIFTNLSISINTLKNKLKNKTYKNCIDVSFHPEFANPDEFISKVKYLNDNSLLRTVSILMLPDYWDICIYVADKLKYTGRVGYSKIKNEDTNTFSIASGYIDYTEKQKEYLNSRIQHTNDGRYTEVIYSNKSVKYKGIEDITNNGITNFKGMHCYIGKTRIHIKSNGDVFPSACLLNYPKARIGNVYRQNLKTMDKPIICPFDFCGCGPDIRIEKKAI